MGFTSRVARLVANYHNDQSLGSRFRAKRIGPLIQMIRDIYRDRGCVNVVDIGGSREYWSIVPDCILRECNVRITVVNIRFNIRDEDDPIFSFVEADACNLVMFSDNCFDIAHSNSVLEHVGDWGKMIKFAGECRRIAASYFVQTPSYWFPIEPHAMMPIFHWLPEPFRVFLVQRIQFGHWQRASSVGAAVEIVQSARLLDLSMFAELFPDAIFFKERFFLMTKSFVAVRSGRSVVSR